MERISMLTSFSGLAVLSIFSVLSLSVLSMGSIWACAQAPSAAQKRAASATWQACLEEFIAFPRRNQGRPIPRAARRRSSDHVHIVAQFAGHGNKRIFE